MTQIFPTLTWLSSASKGFLVPLRRTYVSSGDFCKRKEFFLLRSFHLISHWLDLGVTSSTNCSHIHGRKPSLIALRPTPRVVRNRVSFKLGVNTWMKNQGAVAKGKEKWMQEGQNQNMLIDAFEWHSCLKFVLWKGRFLNPTTFVQRENYQFWSVKTLFTSLITPENEDNNRTYNKVLLWILS